MAKITILALAGGVALGLAGLLAADHWLAAQPPPHAFADFDRIPNVKLITHEGKEVDFYDDLIEGKTVALNFFYVSCTGF